MVTEISPTGSNHRLPKYWPGRRFRIRETAASTIQPSSALGAIHNRRPTALSVRPRLARCGSPGSARILLLGEPFHGARGPRGFGASRCCLALGLQLLGPPAGGFKETPALHVGIEHFQGPAASVDPVMG